MPKREAIHCVAVTATGKRCRRTVVPGSGYCRRHAADDEAAVDSAEKQPDPFAALRDLTPEEWRAIAAAHATWLQSKGANGTRADLSGKRLQMINLPPTSLAEARLENTVFSHSSLQHCSFHQIEARGAYFTSCELQDSIFPMRTCGARGFRT